MAFTTNITTNISTQHKIHILIWHCLSQNTLNCFIVSVGISFIFILYTLTVDGEVVDDVKVDHNYDNYILHVHNPIQQYIIK